mgnify:CR=1 FL=1
MFNFINYKLSNAKTLINYFPIVLKHANGIFVKDLNNKKYIDCILAAGTLPLGHNHPIINNCLKQFSENNYPVQTMDIPTELQYNFLKSLYNFIPNNISNDYKIQMCSPSGGDTIESAIKLAKIATQNNTILSFIGGYHGQSLGASSISGKVRKSFIYSGMSDVHFLPYPSNDYILSTSHINEYINDLLNNTQSGISKPAAIIFESIQGEGGINIAPKEFIQNLRKITYDLDIPLIADEVQTGFCRTGEKFAFQHSDIVPDMICMAKAIGGSQPLACLLHHEKLDKWSEFNHSGTWRGNQLGFLTGKHIIDYMQHNQSWINAKNMGNIIITKLKKIQNKYEIITNTRGKGLMIAFDIIDHKTKKPNPSQTLLFQQKCMANGLLLLKSGKHGNVIRLMCPLNIKESEIDEIIFIINKTLSQL